jgi:hypothetical protein
MSIPPYRGNIWQSPEAQKILAEVLPNFPGIEDSLQRLLDDCNAHAALEWAQKQKCRDCTCIFDKTGVVVREGKALKSWICGDCVLKLTNPSDDEHTLGRDI